MILIFKVPSVPVAQPRARAVSVNGSARVYSAKKEHPVHAFKASVRASAVAEYDGPPLEGPLAIQCTFVLPRPKAMRWKTKPMPRVYDTRKRSGDFDNLAKAVCDALNELLYLDDSQIAQADIAKMIAAGDEQPHVLVAIRSLK